MRTVLMVSSRVSTSTSKKIACMLTANDCVFGAAEQSEDPCDNAN